MLNEKTISLTQEEICEAAHGNLVSFILVVVQFMRLKDINDDEFWHFIGQKFAPGWADVADGDMEEVALRITRNMASCGAELQTFSQDDRQGQLVFTGWPPEWAIDFLDSSVEDAAPLCEVFRPITQSLGLEYTWHLVDDVIKMVIKRPF